MQKKHLLLFITTLISFLPMLIKFLVMNFSIFFLDRGVFALTYLLLMIIIIPLNIFTVIMVIRDLINKNMPIKLFIFYLCFLIVYIIWGYPEILTYSWMF